MSESRPVIAVIDDYQSFVPSLDAWARLRARLPQADIRVITSQPLDDAAIAQLHDVHYLVLIRERTRVTQGLLDRLPALKALVQTGTAGAPETSHIDQAACARRGIAIIEGLGSDGHSAAEATWALVLAATRQLPGYMGSLQQGRWHQGAAGARLAKSLRGQVFGILGYGRIGQILGRYAQAFDMKLLVWGRENTRAAAQAHGVELASSRDALFQQSDVLALQMRMNAQSRHSVTLRDLGLMKTTALLVNTARPGLIEPGALQAALQAGRPGMAAIDVHENEPVLGTGGLLALPNCMATPHIGYVERNSYETLFSGAFEALANHIEAAQA
jgi:D-3-phosphoglycerate dehydrogenase